MFSFRAPESVSVLGRMAEDGGGGPDWTPDGARGVYSVLRTEAARAARRLVSGWRDAQAPSRRRLPAAGLQALAPVRSAALARSYYAIS